jgi:hypothetical protein
MDWMEVGTAISVTIVRILMILSPGRGGSNNARMR